MTNIWRLLWTYVVKPPPENRKKAWCVCDGSLRARKKCNIGHRFASCLDHDGERIFWSIAAKRNLIVIGADISNAFAEAPPPTEKLYIIPDNIFLDWWTNHKKRDPIPTGWVMEVLHTLQGHPEAARLWDW
jgi:hypothetical protein